MRRLFFILFIAILGAAGWLAWGLLAPASGDGKMVMLRPGYSTRKISDELESAGVIRSAPAFLLWHYLHPRGSLKAGEYRFDGPASAIAVHRRLVRGDIYFHTLVIPEGYTVFDIARAFEEAHLGTSQDFLKLATAQTSLISDLDAEARSLEGYLSPNTYQFTRTQTMQDMLASMVREFRRTAQQIGLTSDFHRIVTMASIIEKETAVASERPLVASVYYNRLANNIGLDADPSVIYGELLKGTYQGTLHHQDMLEDSPYNTYRHAGLPPGPIGNPGRSSLEAAMHPAVSDFYYFVADGSGDGHHRFAATLDEHNRNVVAYRRAVRGQ